MGWVRWELRTALWFSNREAIGDLKENVSGKVGRWPPHWCGFQREWVVKKGRQKVPSSFFQGIFLQSKMKQQPEKVGSRKVSVVVRTVVFSREILCLCHMLQIFCWRKLLNRKGDIDVVGNRILAELLREMKSMHNWEVGLCGILVLHIQDDSPSVVGGKAGLQEQMQKGGEMNPWFSQWNGKQG